MAVMTNVYETLRYDEKVCIRCGMCITVCPHGVFSLNGGPAELVAIERCMECGACAQNCPVEAIKVDVGVGCASALIKAALTGGEPTCGSVDCCGTTEASCGESEGCCGGSDTSCGCGEASCESTEPADKESTSCCGGNCC